MQISRIDGYRWLESGDLTLAEGKRVFFDPADTEVGAHVGADLINRDSKVLDLGSGSGATAAAFVRAGASVVHGVDLSTDSVQWSNDHYKGRFPGALSFGFGDFLRSSSEELWPYDEEPTLVTSNPAYVPLPATIGIKNPSVYGGSDGLMFLQPIIQHAQAFDADLGITIGSYSSPERAVEILNRAGYFIKALTLCTLPLGEITLTHPAKIFALERDGHAFLLRSMDEIGYLIIGMACVRGRNSEPSSPSPQTIKRIISCAAASKTHDLGALDMLSEDSDLCDFPVRILRLPVPSIRQHF